MPSTLRISCEGQLEVLEDAAAELGTLASALAGLQWAQALSGADLAGVDARTSSARKVVVGKLELDVEQEAQRALEQLSAARSRVRTAVRARALQLGVPQDGKLNELVARISSLLPIAFEAEVLGAQGPSKSRWPLWAASFVALVSTLYLGSSAFGLLLVGLWRHGLDDLLRAGRMGAGAALAAWVLRWLVREGNDQLRQRKLQLVVTGRTLILGGRTLSFEAGPTVSFSPDEGGLTRVVISTPWRAIAEFRMADAATLGRVLGASGVTVQGMSALPRVSESPSVEASGSAAERVRAPR